MKKLHTLFNLANNLKNKYAQSQTLHQILENAASWGEDSANGIMNFPAMLKKQQATLSITVNIASAVIGNYNVDVSSPIVSPAQFAPVYDNLPTQIKAFLEKHINSFPSIQPGSYTLNYS